MEETEDESESEMGMRERMNAESPPPRSLSTQARDALALDGPGANRTPSPGPASRGAAGAHAGLERGAASPPLSPARCAAAGSRGGLCSSGAGQDPSSRGVPALPELETVGVGTARQARGPKKPWRVLLSLGFRSFAPFRN